MNLVQKVTIDELSPIKDADKIERARVLGWDCVVRKGLYNVGDECLFVFPDTMVPKKYLDSTYTGDEVIRLKTVKMKGQLSAGLILPLSLLEGLAFEFNNLSDALGIKKYEKSIEGSISGNAKGNYPIGYISKTDEDNLKSVPACIDDLECYDGAIFMTLKIDGTSTTVILDRKEEEANWFKVCSRNLELKRDESSVYWMMVMKYDLENKLKSLDDDFAIQFETYGNKINGNKLKRRDIGMMVFHVKNLTSGKWLGFNEMKEFCNKLEIPMVPILNTFTKEEFLDLVKSRKLYEMVNELRYEHGGYAEGAVFKTEIVYRSYSLSKPWWSVKIINENYKDD